MVYWSANNILRNFPHNYKTFGRLQVFLWCEKWQSRRVPVPPTRVLTYRTTSNVWVNLISPNSVTANSTKLPFQHPSNSKWTFCVGLAPFLNKSISLWRTNTPTYTPALCKSIIPHLKSSCNFILMAFSHWNRFHRSGLRNLADFSLNKMKAQCSVWWKWLFAHVV